MKPQGRQMEAQPGSGPRGNSLWLNVADDLKDIQFTILGPRLGVKAVDFVTPRRLR
jgi:hypothetical protein